MSILKRLLAAFMALLLVGCATESPNNGNRGDKTTKSEKKEQKRKPNSKDKGQNSTDKGQDSDDDWQDSDDDWQDSDDIWQNSAEKSETDGDDLGDMTDNTPDAPTFDINGRDFTVLSSACCLTDEGSMIAVSGKWDTLYALLLFASTNGIRANTSFPQSKFGSSKELAVAVVNASSGDSFAVTSRENISDSSFAVSEMSDSGLSVTMTAEFTMEGYDYAVKMSGEIPLADKNTCARIINSVSSLVSNNSGTQNDDNQAEQGGQGGKPVRCAGCYGSGVCRFCKGDRTCHACFGNIDHCLSCGGGNVCQYCGGSGVCKYCGGEKVIR